MNKSCLHTWNQVKDYITGWLILTKIVCYRDLNSVKKNSKKNTEKNKIEKIITISIEK